MSKKKTSTRIFHYVLIGSLLVIFLFPIYWMIISSFHTNPELMRFPPKFGLSDSGLRNYANILMQQRYITNFTNSIIISSSSVILSILLSVFAGYAFSRYPIKGKGILMGLILNVQIFPVTVIIISLFTFYSRLGMLDTYGGIILANIIYSLPFTVWFIKAFFDTIPKSIDEAAFIDGCSRTRVLTSIIVPLITPGIIAIGIYTFLYSWDDFIFALTILRSESMKTLPLGLVQSFMGEYVHDYAGMMTLSVLASLPVVAAFLLTQKYMIAGLTNGAVKG